MEEDNEGASEKTSEEILQEIIQMDPAIRAAYEKLELISRDPEVRRMYYLREMALADWPTGVNKTLDKWRIQTIQNGLKEGLSMELIQKTTGLDMETIQSAMQMSN
jgi:hypothetical protein